MSIKKFIIPAILMCSPYAISNYLVFLFLVPILCLLYSKSQIQIKNAHFIYFAFISACCILLPIIAYDPGVYIIGVAVVTIFVSAFLIVSNKFLKWFKNTWVSMFIPSLVWILLLYVLDFRSLVISAFDVGILFSTSAPLIWYTGSIGLTLLIILFNSALAQYLVKRDRLSLITAGLLLSIFLFSHIFSLTGDPAYLHNSEKAEKIALIQGDVPRGTMWGYTERLDRRISRYVGISEKVREKGVDLVVWPEFTFPIDVMNEFPKKMEPVIDEIKKAKAYFIIGSLLTDQTNNENYHYNSALVFGKNGTLADIYYSQEPTMFNKNICIKDNGEKLYLDNMGITLCWEELNAEIFRNYVSIGAEYFVSLSSNTDFDYSWFKRYVSFFSRARAAESMRYLARSTQTGITQIVNPFGKIVQKLPSNCSTFLVAEVYGIRKKTFYSCYGDIFTRVFVIFMIFCAFIEKIWKKFRIQLKVRT